MHTDRQREILLLLGQPAALAWSNRCVIGRDLWRPAMIQQEVSARKEEKEEKKN